MALYKLIFELFNIAGVEAEETRCFPPFPNGRRTWTTMNLKPVRCAILDVPEQTDSVEGLSKDVMSSSTIAFEPAILAIGRVL